MKRGLPEASPRGALRQEPAEVLAVMDLFPGHVDPRVREFWVKQAGQQATRHPEPDGLGDLEARRVGPC
jgi:hypothetical protein